MSASWRSTMRRCNDPCSDLPRSTNNGSLLCVVTTATSLPSVFLVVTGAEDVTLAVCVSSSKVVASNICVDDSSCK